MIWVMNMNNQVRGGYTGKVVRVDLSESRITVEDIDELLYRKYLGAAGGNQKRCCDQQ